MAKTAEERAGMIERANIELSGWLDRLDKAQDALDEFVGYDDQPARLGEVYQWFHQIPKDAAIAITPAAGIILEGGRYSARERGIIEPRETDPRYDNDQPFSGGIAIRAVSYT